MSEHIVVAGMIARHNEPPDDALCVDPDSGESGRADAAGDA
jgi:hypothetical protein